MSNNCGGIEIHNCWDCDYMRKGGLSFPGKCSWFRFHNKGDDKEIPPSKVDFGCKFWVLATPREK